MAATEAIKEAIWLKGLAKEIGFNSENITVNCDSQSALHLMEKPIFHEMSKHIRDVISNQDVYVKKIHTNHNPVDMFTKAVTQAKFGHCLELLNLRRC